eukprot:Trichotokara_eunicae@DN4178_c0_g1_i5.p1
MWDRMTKRGYSEAKIQNNLEAEIFQVVREEVLEWIGGDDWPSTLSTKKIKGALNKFVSQDGTVVLEVENNTSVDFRENLRAVSATSLKLKKKKP